MSNLHFFRGISIQESMHLLILNSKEIEWSVLSYLLGNLIQSFPYQKPFSSSTLLNIPCPFFQNLNSDLKINIKLQKWNKIIFGGIQKLHWQDFDLFWPPTYPLLTFLRNFHIFIQQNLLIICHLPTSSCQRSFRMTP